MKWNYLDLFSGIGGFHLGLEWAGFDFAWVGFSDIDEFCNKVYLKHWPNTHNLGDIKNIHAKDLPKIDILTGGFPCQPFSCAGKRKGKDDDRHLWPEMLRVIKETRPTWCICENVAGLISMGLDQVLSDLEGEAYQVQPFLIPACALNAPHRRDRLWIIAHAIGTRLEDGIRCGARGVGEGLSKTTSTNLPKVESPDRHAPDTKCLGWEKGTRDRIEYAKQITEGQNIGNGNPKTSWHEPWLEVATRLCRVDDGLPRQVDRVNRLKALGNAVVPQIVEVIGRCILATGAG